ncbi:liprin-beta-1b isoform X7 [Brienomyrus brachyistius]|uniref:liprin-beta-1b isoform X7 n=1 Tax=Brienomyrus brachyistius TaxID=42636 RepID=UPI0020B31D5F|nr:liprin-beta-1b isoform X7 [Brienomyrus brachyistius]
MMSDASDMLAAALEQMDGIIAGSKALDYANGIFDCQSPTSPYMGSLRALHLSEDLRASLEIMGSEERESLRCQIPNSTSEYLMEWLQGPLTNGHISLGGDVYQERLGRLESDKESLILQVSVLTDQVEAQGEKIRDLDLCLEEHREKLNATEEMLQQELLSRNSLETQKLALMAEVSNLNMKLTTMGKDQLEFDDRFRDSEGLIQEISDLRYRVKEMEDERLQYEKKLKSTKDDLGALKRQLENRDVELERLQGEAQFQSMESREGAEKVFPTDESYKKKLKEKHFEVQKMKKAVESLMAANEEKDRKIEELRQSLNRYKKVQDMVMSVQGKKDKLKDGDSDETYSDISASLMASVAAELEKPSSPVFEDMTRKSPDERAPCPDLLHGSPTVYKASSETNVDKVPGDGSTLAVSVTQKSALCDSLQSESIVKAGSVDNLDSAEKSKSSDAADTIASLPPKSPTPAEDESFGSRKARSSFGRGFFKIKGGKRTASAPNLAETEREGTEHLDLAGMPRRTGDSDSTNTLPSSPEGKKKSKGIKKFFGKLKRSQSTTFNPDDDMSETEFKRGGVRSTAGPRLGWSRDLQNTKNELDAPFARWTKEQVCSWLQEQGLGMYVPQARHWVLSGQTLLQASQQDLEKEMGIKHPLHRKKLQLALQSLGSEEDDNKGKLDYTWVAMWLDDIGLPQYKTQFDEGRVDGRMLHYMTVDDLLSLKVGSVLHHLSIKRAIQVLRLNHFEPNCLRRRPSDENNVTPAEISQWTNHRVMEWLRSVDLAEYAPNLRGSGVHGGLMVLEPRFNVETLALLLNIPPNKTLLRRHLATHFSLLIGREAQQTKQECLEGPDYVLLTATAKVKPRKLTFGTFGRLRSKRHEESEEYICPMDLEMPKGSSFLRGHRIYDDELDRLEQMEDSEGTVRQIGAFSEGINNLTSMLKDDELFKELAACSPDSSMMDENL